MQFQSSFYGRRNGEASGREGVGVGGGFSLVSHIFSRNPFAWFSPVRKKKRAERGERREVEEGKGAEKGVEKKGGNASSISFQFIKR